jgi:anti-sigma factor RsiW
MTESWDCAETRISLGVYVLGAIDPAERARVDAHLATCRDCRDELAGLAGIPALLARVSPEEIDRIAAEEAGPAGSGRSADEPPPPELIGSVLDLAAARRRRTRWRYAASAAAVVALAGGVFGGLAASTSPKPPAPVIAFSPGNTTWERVTAASHTTDANATVEYGAVSWGTVLAAKVEGIPVGTTCVLWAVHRDGTRTQAMTWTTAGDEGKVWYWGSLSMPSTNKGITGFQVTEGKQLLVSVPA